MNPELTVFLVLRKGGEYTFQHVELLVYYLNLKWKGSIQIKCLTNTVTSPIQLKDNLELLPLGIAWPGWWSKMNLFAPELEKYRPFLYVDLDTAIVGSLNEILPPKDPTQFISLENVYFPGRMGSGLMWIPAENEKVTRVWEEWCLHSKEVMLSSVHPHNGKVLKGDQDFIESAAMPDSWFGELRVVSCKPLPYQHFRKTITPELVIVYFHGKPRPWQASNISWVSDYLYRKPLKIENKPMNIQEAVVINLDRRKDRLTEFQAQKIPLNVERFPAIEHERGIVGCNKSHLAILERPHKYPFIVFEDDCEIIGDWVLIEKAMSQLPSGWDLLYLGANLNKPQIQYSENLYRLQDAWTTHAIVYGSQRVVDYIVKQRSQFEERTIDVFYAKDVTMKFKCFMVRPMLAIQRKSFSDIQKGERDYQPDILQNLNKYAK